MLTTTTLFIRNELFVCCRSCGHAWGEPYEAPRWRYRRAGTTGEVHAEPCSPGNAGEVFPCPECGARDNGTPLAGLMEAMA